MAARSSPNGQRRRRIFLVDEQPVFRDGFAQLLSLEPDLCVCGQTGNTVRAIHDIPRAEPDCVISDIAPKGDGGFEIIKRIRLVCAALPILAFSVLEESICAERALRAGARGYVMKRSSTPEVLAAIRTVLRGEIYLSSRMRERMIERVSSGNSYVSGPGLNLLSDRQLEVFQLIGDGLGTREIAEKLRLSGKTIEAYRAHIKQKLNLRNNLELIRVAMETVHQPAD